MGGGGGKWGHILKSLGKSRDGVWVGRCRERWGCIIFKKVGAH